MLCVTFLAAAGCVRHDHAGPAGSTLTADPPPAPTAESGKTGENGEAAGAPGKVVSEGELACSGETEPFGKLTLVKTDSGFELQDGGREPPAVMQTLLSPPGNGTRYAVQIVRRTVGDAVTRYRKDAIVLDFVGRNEPTCRAYPLFEAYVNDMYNVDSVTEAYGFLDADRLLYVAASGDDPTTGQFSYRVLTLDLRTGKNEVLFADIPGAPTDEFFAPGWLTADQNTLVLQTYQTGKLWTFNLGKREVRQSARLFPHSWPFILTVPSPDGALFWYTDVERREYRLHRADGTPVARVAFPPGFDDYPPFRWTPDRRFAAYAYTRDQSDDHVLGSDEVIRFAPQGIRFFDRRGKLALTVETNRNSGEYVELAAWLDNGQEALLHFFKVNRSGIPPEKQTLRYERLRIDTGERTALTIADAPSTLAHPVYALPPQSGPLYWIDNANNRIYAERLTGVTLQNDTSAPWAWYALDEERQNAVLYRFDAEQKAVSALTLETPAPWPDAIVHDWLMANASYIRIARATE